MRIAEVAKELSQKFNCPKKLAENIINEFIASVAHEINADKKSLILGFGSFKVIEKAEHNGVNPRTGEKLVIPAHKCVKFSASKGLLVEDK